MPKRVITFKPTQECEVQMAGLMDRWGCDRTAVLIKAVAMAHGDGARVAKIETARTDKPELVKQASANAGRFDPDKLAAFQKRAGMGGVKQRN